MYAEDQPRFTKLTMQVGDTVTTWETPHDDLSMEDLLQGFMGLAIGHAWLPITVLTCMKEFAEEQLEVLEDK